MHAHVIITAEISEQGGEDLGLHLKLLSMLDNPAVIVAAAASGDVGTLQEYLRKHPSQVRYFQVLLLENLCIY